VSLSVNFPQRLIHLLLPPTPRGAVLAICTAAVFLVVETVLVILLEQADPRSPVGVVYAVDGPGVVGELCRRSSWGAQGGVRAQRLAEQFVPAERTDLKKQLADLTAELAEATTELGEQSRGLGHPPKP